MQNDSNAPFEEELQQAQVPILGYLVRLCGNLADARDLLQVTNLTAWEKRESFESGTSAVAWMRVIALNHYRNESRKWQSRPTVPLLDSDLEQMVETRHHERELEDARRRKLLQSCLGQLPDRQREAVEHFYLKGESLDEVAVILKRKSNAVGQLLHRARQNLIDCVQRESHRELDGDGLKEL